ncbi:hypothetical protein [Paraburkholderia dioscoreae]|uniref:Uncharacterized protein n=1 Tax=Paraburkholderia dioscoreae TaxID=2604047 RepID=A0A5Q4YTI1_9BURK|nr:hypothetical protein [Paraburkholderia dioscoreae]VVD29211.1 protein of unknown function [Paraburkholderia dioscoreae]
MGELSILFSGAMVRAPLDGSKAKALPKKVGLMKLSVHQHPYPTARHVGANSHKYAAVSRANVVLLYTLAVHVALVVERHGLLRIGAGRRSIEVRARCARLNPDARARLTWPFWAIKYASLAAMDMLDDLAHAAMSTRPPWRNRLDKSIDLGDAERRVENRRVQTLQVSRVKALSAFFIEANLLHPVSIRFNAQPTLTRGAQNCVDETTLVHGALPPSFSRIVA